MERLAILGGKPVRTIPFPSVNDKSGRDIGNEELALITEVINSGKLNRVWGTMTPQFEKEVSRKYGIKFAVATTSGTAAIHTALASLNFDPGDEVITTTVTDFGTVIPILAQNLIPIFADIDPITGNIKPDEIKKKISEKTRAIIVVHLFGNPCDLDPILKIADENNLYVIEDACQSHLAEYKGKLVGTIGDLGCFSLQQSKQITCGDGGIVITNDETVSHRATLFVDKAWPRDTGRDHLFLGLNYRMTELQGAVALAQIRKLDKLITKRRKTAELLTTLITEKEIKGIKPTPIIDGCKSAYWMYSFTINEKIVGTTAKEFERAINAEGIPARTGYIPKPVFSYDVIRERKTYGKSECPWSCSSARQNIEYHESEYPNTLKFLENVLFIGWNEGFTDKDVEDIVTAMKKVVDYYPKK